MGLRSNILPIVDSIVNHKTLQQLNLSANQLTALDEEYILDSLSIRPQISVQQLLLENDKYLSKIWK